MRLLSTTLKQLGMAVFVIIAGIVLAPGDAQGQDSEACPECGVNPIAAGHSVHPGEKPSGVTEASLFGTTTSDAWTIHERVDEVTVFFSASDHHKFVQGLSQDNIRVTDDGKAVTKISAFRAQSDLPLRLGLLVDTSASVNPRFRFEQQASVQFLRQVVRPGRDQAFVLGFANDINVTQDYSDDPEQLAAGVAALRNGGGTAFFDAIEKACDKLMAEKDSEPAARVLIVLSDGDDNQSDSTLLQAIERAQMRDVTIYTMNTSEWDHWKRMQEPSDVALKRLAEETGGRSFAQMTKADLKNAFSAIEKEIRNRYALSYQPGDLQEDGRFRHIQIAAEKSGRRFHVHTRKGYYAPLAASAK
jgi:Ca-activated chloride channel homolog